MINIPYLVVSIDEIDGCGFSILRAYSAGGVVSLLAHGKAANMNAGEVYNS